MNHAAIQLWRLCPGGFVRAFKRFFQSASLHFCAGLVLFCLPAWFAAGVRDGGKNMSENRTRFRLDQRRAPIYEALEQFRQMRVVPFDVPGHKRGRGNPELTAFLDRKSVV